MLIESFQDHFIALPKNSSAYYQECCWKTKFDFRFVLIAIITLYMLLKNHQLPNNYL